MDQLYQIQCTIGDLLPRHLHVFKTNEYFQGISLPTPQQLYPLEMKLTHTGPDVIDFLKVLNLLTCLKTIDFK